MIFFYPVTTTSNISCKDEKTQREEGSASVLLIIRPDTKAKHKDDKEEEEEGNKVEDQEGVSSLFKDRCDSSRMGSKTRRKWASQCKEMRQRKGSNGI